MRYRPYTRTFNYKEVKRTCIPESNLFAIPFITEPHFMGIIASGNCGNVTYFLYGTNYKLNVKK